jgi:hypothetical protein
MLHSVGMVIAEVFHVVGEMTRGPEGPTKKCNADELLCVWCFQQLMTQLQVLAAGAYAFVILLWLSLVYGCSSF